MQNLSSYSSEWPYKLRVKMLKFERTNWVQLNRYLVERQTLKWRRNNVKVNFSLFTSCQAQVELCSL